MIFFFGPPRRRCCRRRGRIPGHRCGPGGVCHGPHSPTAAQSVAGNPFPSSNMYDSCVTYNRGAFYPEYNQAGVCITAAAVTGNRHNLAYLEKTIGVNGMPGKAAWTNRLIQV